MASSTAGPPAPITLLHFNDVYNIHEQEKEPVGGAARFAHAVKQLRAQHDAVVAFSGDCFNPSIESSITKGKHMVSVMNALGVDVACWGNHEFDNGVAQCARLGQQCRFPWLCSNVTIDGEPMALARVTAVIEKGGHRLGFIGIAEREWLDTLPQTPTGLEFYDAVETTKTLAKQLRDVDGVDFVIVLSHMRLPNDERLAEACKDDVDLILGGHDHFYCVLKEQEVGHRAQGHFVEEKVVTFYQGDDAGNLPLLVKSGKDFQQLSLIQLFPVASGDRQTRRGRVRNVTVQRHNVSRTTFPPDPDMVGMVQDLSRTLSGALLKTIGHTEVPLDARFPVIRAKESNLGNFVADLLRFAYPGVEMAIIGGGTFRTDDVIPAGPITLKDVLRCFPFQDPVIVLQVKGSQIWDALENGVSAVPKLEGRFPQVSGMRVRYDPSAPPFHRLLSVEVIEEVGATLLSNPHVRRRTGSSTPRSGKEAVGTGSPSPPLTPTARTHILDLERLYTLVTRAYLAEGRDGYAAFKNAKYIVDEEAGLMISTLVRQYFMGLKYINAFLHQDSLADDELTVISSSGKALQPDAGSTKDATVLHKKVVEKAVERFRRLLKKPTAAIRTDKDSALLKVEKLSRQHSIEFHEALTASNRYPGLTSKVERGHRKLIQSFVTIAPEVEGRLQEVFR